MVDEQNQQNHIAHEALFQRAGNSDEGCNGIDYGGKRTQICMAQNGTVNREDENVALSTNLNFKRVVGCQVFWPLKRWYFVWYVLKTKDNKSCTFCKYVWPDIGDIDSVERLHVKILPNRKYKDGQELWNLSERNKLKYKVQSNEYYT